jgi:YfiH family protein
MTERTFVPDWPDLPAHIGVLSTLRGGGCSLAPHDDGTGLAGGFNLATHVGDDPMHVNQNRTVLAQLLPSAPRWLTQVHGTRVIDLGMPEINLNADACFSTQPGVVCAVQTADCLPVLICDGTKNVVAAAHAGWRGLVSGVLENTLEQMQIAGAEPQNITVWLGPAIGPLQFEVGPEVRERFLEVDSCASAAFKASDERSGKYYADIYLLARQRLQRAGVLHVHGGDFCTVTEREKFYSYRRDGVTGRMASLIWIRN